jgi:2'-5' RNA ligase
MTLAGHVNNDKGFPMIKRAFHLAALGLFASSFAAHAAAPIDNSALDKPEFRAHKATYGVVYRLPQDANAVLDAKITGTLKQDLLALGLKTEAETPNMPHVTVVHIHSADPETPARMLRALPKPPAPLQVTLKTFYPTEAAKGAGHPWWLDLGVVKSGQGFEDMMRYNTVTTAALAPLRDGPLPRVTGPVYAKMGDAGKDLVKMMGVSGVNIMQDGKEVRAHNPHTTLVYSMAIYDTRLQDAMKQESDKFNAVLPDGINTTFKDVSIVEIGFAGNVVREIYRVSLEDGSVIDVATGKKVGS